jgi:TRAP-type C4-dicarboxylate transport system substrate-binding protein
LTSAEKAILEQAAANATAYVREGAEKSLKEREKYLMDKGMTILELSDETKKEMKSRALPVYDRVRKLVMDEELIDLYIGKGVGY